MPRITTPAEVIAGEAWNGRAFGQPENWSATQADIEAIASVIANRMDVSGLTAEQITQNQKEFNAYNQNRTVRADMVAAAQRALDAAARGELLDPTNGATFYARRSHWGALTRKGNVEGLEESLDLEPNGHIFGVDPFERSFAASDGEQKPVDYANLGARFRTLNPATELMVADYAEQLPPEMLAAIDSIQAPGAAPETMMAGLPKARPAGYALDFSTIDTATGEPVPSPTAPFGSAMAAPMELAGASAVGGGTPGGIASAEAPMINIGEMSAVGGGTPGGIASAEAPMIGLGGASAVGGGTPGQTAHVEDMPMEPFDPYGGLTAQNDAMVAETVMREVYDVMDAKGLAPPTAPTPLTRSVANASAPTPAEISINDTMETFGGGTGQTVEASGQLSPSPIETQQTALPGEGFGDPGVGWSSPEAFPSARPGANSVAPASISNFSSGSRPDAGVGYQPSSGRYAPGLNLSSMASSPETPSRSVNARAPDPYDQARSDSLDAYLDGPVRMGGGGNGYTPSARDNLGSSMDLGGGSSRSGVDMSGTTGAPGARNPEAPGFRQTGSMSGTTRAASGARNPEQPAYRTVNETIQVANPAYREPGPADTTPSWMDFGEERTAPVPRTIPQTITRQVAVPSVYSQNPVTASAATAPGIPKARPADAPPSIGQILSGALKGVLFGGIPGALIGGGVPLVKRMHATSGNPGNWSRMSDPMDAAIESGKYHNSDGSFEVDRFVGDMTKLGGGGGSGLAQENRAIEKAYNAAMAGGANRSGVAGAYDMRTDFGAPSSNRNSSSGGGMADSGGGTSRSTSSGVADRQAAARDIDARNEGRASSRESSAGRGW